MRDRKETSIFALAIHPLDCIGIGLWCNGSTRHFGRLSSGSKPDSPTQEKHGSTLWCTPCFLCLPTSPHCDWPHTPRRLHHLPTPQHIGTALDDSWNKGVQSYSLLNHPSLLYLSGESSPLYPMTQSPHPSQATLATRLSNRHDTRGAVHSLVFQKKEEESQDLTSVSHPLHRKLLTLHTEERENLS